jgi:hypothetical protein
MIKYALYESLIVSIYLLLDPESSENSIADKF